ncbi:MAG: hypothetical protein OXC07_01955 [Kistimonas sp.]|nr:hypothetical protein [Kistimonas sp.]
MSGKKLFVANLDYSTTQQELEQKFSEHGPIREAKIIKDGQERSRGYGFVTFEQEKDAKAALDKMNASKIGQRIINVDFARTK